MLPHSNAGLVFLLSKPHNIEKLDIYTGKAKPSPRRTPFFPTEWRRQSGICCLLALDAWDLLDGRKEVLDVFAWMDGWMDGWMD